MRNSPRSTVRDELLNGKPPIGSFGLSKVGNTVGTFIHIGQFILGDSTPYGHAFIVVGDNEIVQAEPGGAALRSLDSYLDREGRSVVFHDPIPRAAYDYIERNYFSDQYYHGAVDLLRHRVASHALDLRGTPYSYLDYVYLALTRFRAGGPLTEAIARRMMQTKEMICSQAVDEAYRRAGIHLFDDGRLPQEVTPGDLDRYRRDHE